MTTTTATTRISSMLWLLLLLLLLVFLGNNNSVSAGFTTTTSSSRSGTTAIRKQQQQQRSRIIQHPITTITTTTTAIKSSSCNHNSNNNNNEIQHKHHRQQQQSLLYYHYKTKTSATEYLTRRNNNNNNNRMTILYASSSSFSEDKQQQQQNQDPDKNKKNDNSKIWNPSLRYIMSGIASFGVLETFYLTITKLIGQPIAFCSSTITDSSSSSSTGSLLSTIIPSSLSSSNCNSILNSPYAYIPGTHLPISLLGFIAYSLVLYASIQPLLLVSSSSATEKSDESNIIIETNDDIDDSMNRIFLTILTSSMGLFSFFLMYLLFNIINESCPYCIASAIFSISLSLLCWFGGAIPKQYQKNMIPITSIFSTGLASTFAIAIYFGNNNNNNQNIINSVDSTSPSSTSRLLASIGKATTGKEDIILYSPPDITTISSNRAIELATNLQLLDSKFYGAYWCSHCYDQKQSLGKEAMGKIPYIECAKDGMNSKRQLCQEKQIPGYPTWEIADTLYPGEQSIEELEEIVNLKQQQQK